MSTKEIIKKIRSKRNKDLLKKKMEYINILNSLVTTDGAPYFSTDYIKKIIIGK